MKKKTQAERERRSDQGEMNELSTQRVLNMSKPGGGGAGRVAKRNRMVRFARRVERSLDRNNALPNRSSRDRSMIGDLADLEARLPRLRVALNAFVAQPRSQRGEEPFDRRLIRLAAEVDGLRAVLRDLNPTLRRLVKRRCGNVGLAVAALVDASGALE